MYKIRNKVYSEAGYILVGENKRGYQFDGEMANFMEEAITIDDMTIQGDFVTYGGILQYIGENPTYETLKRDMVKRRYSNDDQIAIMLNGDAESLVRMQDWRDWSGQVAHKIIETLNP